MTSSSPPSPEVWFAIPSANPENCRRVLPVWQEMGYKVAVLQNRHRAEIPADKVVWADAYPGWAASINVLCESVVPKSAAIVISGGDDMLPDPHHSAEALAKEFVRKFPDGFGVMQPAADGFLGARFFCGSPWIGRGWIDRAYGGRGPMHAAYRHNWADNELYWVARCLGALWMRPDLSQEHRHFTRSGDATPPPEYWTEQVSAHDRADVQTFIARAWTRFPGCEPLGGKKVFDAAMFDREYPRLAERHWMTKYGMGEVCAGPEGAIRSAMARCAAEGLRRVAIFGAGSHTRAAAGALMCPPSPVEIVAVIDESPQSWGTWLWGWPVVDVSEAAAMRLDAVVISANSQTADLARRAKPLADVGARVIVPGDGAKAPKQPETAA